MGTVVLQNVCKDVKLLTNLHIIFVRYRQVFILHFKPFFLPLCCNAFFEIIYTPEFLTSL